MSTLFLTLLLIMLIAGLLSGFPVAFVLAGTSLIIALLANLAGHFDIVFLTALPNRLYGIMTNDLLIAVPVFIFMGTMLEKAKIAEELLENMSKLFGQLQAGLALSVLAVGTLLAASTGIVGATVVTMGLISLPTMLKAKYDPKIATGTICAAGTLGQIIPPSIVLILLGDQISNAYQTAQLKAGNLSPEPVSIADLFLGALIPGIGLVILYAIWILINNYNNTHSKQTLAKKQPLTFTALFKTLAPPLLLIILVLGSILTGLATATESASIGAVGAMLLAYCNKQLSLKNLRDVCQSTAQTTSMVFTILIGAAIFTLVFRGLGGDDTVHHFLSNLQGGLFTAMLITMIMMFFLGFFLDFIEIIFVVVPIVAPVLLLMGADPIWLAIMIAINLQTSFLTPPFGFALFYLRGVAPKTVKTTAIYKGIMPFVTIQLIALTLLATTPSLATWLPENVYGSKETYVPQSYEDLEIQSDIDW